MSKRGKGRDPWALFQISGSKNWYYKHPDQPKRSTGTTRRADAVEVVEAARRRYQEEERYGSDARTFTFAQAVIEWAQAKAARGDHVNALGNKRLEGVLAKFGDWPIAQIKQKDLDAYAEELQAGREKPLAPGTLDTIVYAPFIAVWRGVSGNHDLPPRNWRRPKKVAPSTPRPVGDQAWLDRFVAACRSEAAQHRVAARQATREGDWRAAGRYQAWGNNKLRLAALQCYLFHSGRRLASVLQADVDLRGQTVTVTRSKQSRPETLPLTPDAHALLSAVPLLEDKPFGFSASSHALKAIRKLCERNDLPYLTSHESGRRGALNDTRENHPDIEHEAGNRALGWAAGSSIPDRVYRDVNAKAVEKVVMRNFR